ncbi:AtpZ/AtpI family protein [Flavobacteriales bacterium]|jgi:hypothetical protein|nr:AtpZ/AtpI family protein [Flavobacteriales bacterium]MDC3220518.1 AtpZ/AtpI family protein [Flavobacteriales bacterium]
MKNKSTKNILRFSGLGFQLGASIYLGNLLGKWLDTKYPNDGEWWAKGITLFVIFGSIFSIIKQVNKFSQDE